MQAEECAPNWGNCPWNRAQCKGKLHQISVQFAWCKLAQLVEYSHCSQHWSNSNDLIHLLPMTRCLSPWECLHEQCEYSYTYKWILAVDISFNISCCVASPNYWWSCKNGWERTTQWTIPKSFPVSQPIPPQHVSRWIHIQLYTYWRRWNWLHSVAS